MPASQALASIPEALGLAFVDGFAFVDAALFFRFGLQGSRIHQNLFGDAFARWQNRQGPAEKCEGELRSGAFG
jgi:hypothetical protein